MPKLTKKLPARKTVRKKAPKRAPRVLANGSYATKKKQATVVSFFGGPGAGKSTLAAGVFYDLKRRGVNVEFVHEFAKELTWENRMGTLSNQTLILGQQFEMFRRCADQVDLIITDTSLLNSAIYCHNFGLPYAEEIEKLALQMYRSMDNFTFVVQRVLPWVQTGRYNTEEEGDVVARKVRAKCADYGLGFREIPGNDLGKAIAVDEIETYMEGGLPAVLSKAGGLPRR